MVRTDHPTSARHSSSMPAASTSSTRSNSAVMRRRSSASAGSQGAACADSRQASVAERTATRRAGCSSHGTSGLPVDDGQVTVHR